MSRLGARVQPQVGDDVTIITKEGSVTYPIVQLFNNKSDVSGNTDMYVNEGTGYVHLSIMYSRTGEWKIDRYGVPHRVLVHSDPIDMVELGKIDVLDRLARSGVLPEGNTTRFNIALHKIGKTGNRAMVQWLARHGINVGSNVANGAASVGDIGMLDWLASQRVAILPNKLGVFYAVRLDQMSALQWMVRRGILPTVYDANAAAGRGNIAMLQFMASLNPPILPDRSGVKDAVKGRKLPVLKYLASLRNPILPDAELASIAAKRQYRKILKWMAHLNPPVLPEPTIDFDDDELAYEEIDYDPENSDDDSDVDE
jgi:hypothetical protein